MIFSPPRSLFFSDTKIFSFLIRVGLGVNVSKIANCDWNFSASFKYFLHLYNTKIFTEAEDRDVFLFCHFHFWVRKAGSSLN